MAVKIASLYAEIGADTTKLEKGLASTSTSLKGAAKNTDELSGKIGRFASGFGQFAATAGVTALGAAFTSSLKAANDFEQAFAKISSLTDTASGDIDGLKKSVLSMARDGSIGANELAKGLYFISSSGFKGADAMDVLRASAKAATAGLGETQTIADAVTSALNAYQLSGKEAARITDLLTFAVKEGKGEPAEFAASLGRVLPVAAAAKVGMEDVVSALAIMTRTGLSAEEATTSLRGTIGALLAPTKQSSEALMGIGLTTADVASMLQQPGGLVNVLQTLMERTGGNVEALDAIIPNIRALTGVLSLAGSQGDVYAETLNKAYKAIGLTDKAAQEMSNTFEFKLKKAQNAVEALGITVTNKLLPPLGDAAEAATTLITWSDRLRDAEQGVESQVRITATTYDEYLNTMTGVTRASEEVALITRDLERGLISQAEAQQAIADIVGGVNKVVFEEGRLFAQLAADVGDVAAYQTQIDANQSVEFQAIATAKELKEEAKATKEMLDKMAEATINNYSFVESFKDFTAVSGARTTIADLEELIRANPENRDKYATQIRAISQQFGFTNVAMETGAASFRVLEGLFQTGAISTDSYAVALGKIKQAAADGKVSVDELGLKTGEAAAYMTASTTTAQEETGRLVALDKSSKQQMLDEMGNSLTGQQNKLQGNISSSMLAISNSMTTAASLANVKAGEIKDAWDKVPREVTTLYTIVTSGTTPTDGPGF
ncbi:MAG: phage tail tape measure protein, partial [Xanthomonadales bacterium]|nr:phage tail tape measure protein [Xanthomonadales bacterium]